MIFVILITSCILMLHKNFQLILFSYLFTFYYMRYGEFLNEENKKKLTLCQNNQKRVPIIK